MITQILTILKADTALKTLLGATSTDTHIYPYSAPHGNNVIVYTYSPISDEDAKRIDRLEIRVISNDLGNATAIDNRVRTLLKTIGDTPINSNILNIFLNGGGSLEDTATGVYHIITYYYITRR